MAAASILGGDEEYDPVPYFWSEQFGRMVQYAGHHSAGDRLLWRGDPAAQKWTACWLADSAPGRGSRRPRLAGPPAVFAPDRTRPPWRAPEARARRCRP